MIGGRRAGSRGFIYTLGPSGARMLTRQDGRRARRLSAPGDRYTNHTLAVSDLYVQLVSAERAGRPICWPSTSSRECWAQFPGAWGVTLTLKPDAHIKLGIGDYDYTWMVEFDMATESLPPSSARPAAISTTTDRGRPTRQRRRAARAVGRHPTASARQPSKPY